MTINNNGFNNLFKHFVKKQFPNNIKKQQMLLQLPLLKKQQILNDYHKNMKKGNTKKVNYSYKNINWSNINHNWKKYLKDDFELHDCGAGGNCFFLCLGRAMSINSNTIRQKLANTINLETINRLKLFYEGHKDGFSEFIDGLNVYGTNKKFEFIKFLLEQDKSIDLFKKIISSNHPVNFNFKNAKIRVSYWGDEWSINKCMEIFPDLRLFILDTGVKNTTSFAWTNISFENKDKNILLFRKPGHYQILYHKKNKKYILENNQIPDYIQTLYLEQFTK